MKSIISKKWLAATLAWLLVAAMWPMPATMASGPAMQWATYGEAVFASPTAPTAHIQVYDGTPYVAYMDNNSHVFVKKMVNGAWVGVGEENIASGAVFALRFFIDHAGNLFVMFADQANYGDRATVMRYDADGDQWNAVGERGYSASFAGSPSIYAEDDVVYTAHLESNNRKLVVTKGENDVWSVIGTFDVVAPLNILTPFIHVRDGVPYVAYVKNHFTDGPLGAVVARYVNDDNWEELGAASISEGEIRIPQLARNAEGDLYMAYAANIAPNAGVYVSMYDSATDAWLPVGGALHNAAVQWNVTSFAIADDGALHVAFRTSVTSGRLMKYASEAEGWVQVGGNVSMSAPLSMDVDGNSPYLAYSRTGSTPNPFVVSVYASSTEADAGRNTLTIEDEPAQVFTGDALRLLASGDRESVAGLVHGDERYVPVSWVSTEQDQTGVFAMEGEAYVSTYTPGTAGNFTVTATFRKDTWNGTAWADAGETDSKEVQLSVLHLPPGAPDNVTAIAGNGQAVLSWSAVPDATDYRIYQSEVQGVQGADITTVTGTTYTVGHLTNGTTYYFTVTAIGPGGEGDPATSAGVTPLAPPGAPGSVTAIAGNRQAQLLWGAVPDATDYRIYQSEAEGVRGAEIMTVTGTTYTIGNLTNGTTYYFTVEAIGAGGEGGTAVSSGVTPVTVPGAPTHVTAVARNGQATVSFTAPADHGGAAITSYTAFSSPEGLMAHGSASPLTVTGLTNGVSYTFAVFATNSVGDSIGSIESAPVVPRRPSVDTSSETPPEPSEQAAETEAVGVSVLVNGNVENAGTVTTDTLGDRTVTTVTVDAQQIEGRLAAEGAGAVVTIPFQSDSDIVIGELTGRTVKQMEDKQATVVIRTDSASFKLPAQHMDVDAISALFGDAAALEDIKIQIEISKPSADTARTVEDAAQRGSLTLVAPPVEFSVRAVYGDRSVEITTFSAYVERSIAIPEGVDPSRITTGVVVDADGVVRHVPTKVELVDGTYYATIHSLTTSIYTVVWNPQQFTDMLGHWGQAAANNMGSRMVVPGMADGSFRPQDAMSRAEYTASVVRALGLKPEQSETPFTDMERSDEYERAMYTAYVYGLVSGYGDSTVRAQSPITREQAFAIAVRAMELTGLQPQLTAQASEDVLQSYSDADDVSGWARLYVADIIRAGVVTGRSGQSINPQAAVTRAEAAMLLQRLLQKSGLINEDN